MLRRGKKWTPGQRTSHERRLAKKVLTRRKQDELESCLHELAQRDFELLAVATNETLVPIDDSPSGRLFTLSDYLPTCLADHTAGTVVAKQSRHARKTVASRESEQTEQ